MIEGMTIADVAVAYGVDRKTVSRWVTRFCDGGSDGLQLKVGSGRPRKLEELTEEELRQMILPGAISLGFETDLWNVNTMRSTRQQERNGYGMRCRKFAEP